MSKKSELFKELGWSEDLIRHYMIEDSDIVETGANDLMVEVHDSHSMTVTFRAENSSASSFVVAPIQGRSER